jgi:hypothetical protein
MNRLHQSGVTTSGEADTSLSKDDNAVDGVNQACLTRDPKLVKCANLNSSSTTVSYQGIGDRVKGILERFVVDQENRLIDKHATQTNE